MKTAMTSIRLTEDERLELDALASRMIVSRSELIRCFIRAGLHKNESTQIIKWDNDTIVTIRDYNMLVAKIGININQIARICNRGNTNVTLTNEIRALQDILDWMKVVVQKCL